jgi:ATP-dependent DNA helicase HFM1/MER3
VFAANELPVYSVTVDEVSVMHSPGSTTVDVELEVQCSASLEGASKSKAQKGRYYHDVTHVLTVTSDLEFIDFRRIP